MTKRADAKQDSLKRILDAGSVRLRREGLSGAAIAPVMADAGLTHGAFYSHFRSKEALAIAAFRHALTEGRPRWMRQARGTTWRERLASLAAYYLLPRQRDMPDEGCAFAALVSEVGRAPDAFRQAFGEELIQSLHAIAETGDTPDAARLDDAIALMAVCVGGLSLARAVGDPAFSDHILKVATDAAARLATAD